MYTTLVLLQNEHGKTLTYVVSEIPSSGINVNFADGSSAKFYKYNSGAVMVYFYNSVKVEKGGAFVPVTHHEKILVTSTSLRFKTRSGSRYSLKTDYIKY